PSSSGSRRALMAETNTQSTADKGTDRPTTGSLRLKLRVPAKLRNLELVLLIFACIINGGALVLVQLGALGEVVNDVILLGAGLAALVFGMHVALRFVAPLADPFILPIATVLNGLGIAEI